jgi:hypothetical protein
MINMEDRLRIVLRDTAREIQPASVRPLDLAVPAVRANVRPFGRRGGRALAALAAAAAVTGVVVTSAALAAGPHRHHPLASTLPHGKLHSTQPGSQPPSLPPYFLELTGTAYPSYDNPLHAAIKATASGDTLAVITPPAPDRTFSAVTAAADDRTFVLAAQPWQPHVTSTAVGLNSGPVTFFLLRFSPGDSRPVLTRLPIPAIQASEETAGPAPVQFGGLALSPDGTQLAVATNIGTDRQQIAIYDVSTGTARTWTAHVANGVLGGNGPGAQNMVDPQALSWTADGTTLAYGDPSGPLAVELLNVAGTSGSLLHDSRLVVPQAGDHGNCIGDMMITPDGGALLCPVSWPPGVAPGGGTGAATVQAGGITVGFGEFSARTGALLRVLDKQPNPNSSPFSQQVLWSSPAGSELVVESALPYLNRVAVLTSGQLALLPPGDRPAIPAAVW